MTATLDAATVSSRRRRRLFTVFAPVTLPAYLLATAAANLLAGAFYVVVEATWSRLIGRPIALTRRRLVLLALPILLLAPVATVMLFAVWFLRMIGRGVRWVGAWQTGESGVATASAAGLIWVITTLWAATTCLNAAIGLGWIGRPMTGRDALVEHVTRFRVLGELPPEMQERRRALIAEIAERREAVHPEWRMLQSELESDSFPFGDLPPTFTRRIVGLPWFFVPAELAPDGQDHSALLLGPLLFVLMLVIRWPGTFAVIRPRVLRGAWFLVRVGVATGAVYALVTWIPRTADLRFAFADGPPTWFLALNPGLWLGMDLPRWVRPEWHLFNAGLWLVLIGLVVFVWWMAWRVSPFVAWPRYYIAFLAARLLQRKRIAFFSVGAVTLCVAMMIIVISVMSGFVDSIRQRAHGLLGDLVMDAGLQGFPFYQEFIDRVSQWRDERTGEPIVVQATPLIHTYGILQFPNTSMTKTVRAWGVRLDEYVRVNKFGDDLFYHNRFGGTTLAPQQQPVYGFDDGGVAALPVDMDDHYRRYVAGLPEAERREEMKRYGRAPMDMFPGPGVFAMSGQDNPRPGYEGKEYPGVIIGRNIIARRTASGEFDRSPRYPRGEPCQIALLPVTRSGAVSQEPPPRPTFRYVDDSRTGIHEIDSINVYVDFDVLQTLLDMQPQQREGGGMTAARCSQLQIKFVESIAESRERVNAMKAEVSAEWLRFRRSRTDADGLEQRMMANVDVATWEEMQAGFISAIEKEKFLVLIMFGVISVVAIFLILCIFYMIVQEKTRDIGIIKSVGGSAEGVTAVFLAYGAAIGLVGAVLGSMLGMVFVEHINDVQDWLARLNPEWRVWSPETYSFDRIPDVWKWSEVIGISVVAVLASIVGAAFPAVRAGRTWPVEALRYE